MMEDDIVRVVDYNLYGPSEHSDRRFGVTITDQQRTTIECGRYSRRENAIKIADAIRHAIDEARNESETIIQRQRCEINTLYNKHEGDLKKARTKALVQAEEAILEGMRPQDTKGDALEIIAELKAGSSWQSG